MQIEFFIQGTPKPQPRVKAFRRGNHAGVFDPGTADDWKYSVARAITEQAQGDVLNGAVWLRLDFALPRPKSHFNKEGYPKANSPHAHTKKPDLDNLAKAVMDAISDTGKVWRDDSQVASMTLTKTYSHASHGCRIHIQDIPVT